MECQWLIEGVDMPQYSSSVVYLDLVVVQSRSGIEMAYWVFLLKDEHIVVVAATARIHCAV
jgi:hypothetical protein